MTPKDFALIVARRAGLGCGDSGCIYGCSGMCTNGGCRCFKHLKTEDRMKVHKHIRILLKLLTESFK